MTFTVEVLLKGHDAVVEEVVHREGNDPASWTEEDAREVLRLILLSFDRVLQPDTAERTVALRGLSWIVTPVDGGVGIAIEIPSGAVVAGPFETSVESLTALVQRALARSDESTTVH